MLYPDDVLLVEAQYRGHVPSPKLLNGFLLDLMFRICSRSCQVNLILIVVGSIWDQILLCATELY